MKFGSQGDLQTAVASSVVAGRRRVGSPLLVATVLVWWPSSITL